MEILKVSEIVESILIKNKESRDSDEILIIEVWKSQKWYKTRDSSYNFSKFAADFIAGEFFKPESIRRSRQRLQEIKPELRGESYKARHDHTAKVKEEIKSIK